MSFSRRDGRIQSNAYVGNLWSNKKICRNLRGEDPERVNCLW